MKWHGSSVFYNPQPNVFENVACDARTKTSRLTWDSLDMFFVDHIAENDKKQDMVFVASIAEALMFRIRKELPEADETAVCTDNARCYKNNFIPVILPDICEAFKI